MLAAITISGIPIITCLYAHIDEAITTRGEGAIREATVIVERITIVAGFTLLDDAIPAPRKLTHVRTLIAVIIVAVIAGLDPLPD